MDENLDSAICVGADFYLDCNNELYVELKLRKGNEIHNKVFCVSYENNLKLDYLIRDIYKEGL